MTDAPSSAAAPPLDRVTRFFDAIRSAAIVRDQDHWIAGVCGGLAVRAGIPPFVVRLIAVILALLSAPAVFAYTVGWALLPDAEGRIHAEEAIRGRFEPVMIAIGFLLVVTFVPFSPLSWWGPAADGPGMPNWLLTTFAVVWSVLITGGLVWLVVYLSRKPPGTGDLPGTSGNAEPADAAAPADSWQHTLDLNRVRQEQNRVRQEQYRARQAERAAALRARRPGTGFTAIVLGIALMCGAVAALVFSDGAWSQASLTLGLAAALGLVALGMMVSGFRGREGGALSGWAFLAVLALLITGFAPTNVQFVLLGSPVWSVSAPTEVDDQSGYALAVGQATLDLSGLDQGPMEYMRSKATQTIDVWVGVGQTRILLPEYAPVLIDTTSVVGAVDYPGSLGGQDQQGIFLNDTRLFNSNDSVVHTVVRIWSGVGEVSIIDPASAREVTP